MRVLIVLMHLMTFLSGLVALALAAVPPVLFLWLLWGT
jgi:hypothetical protein